MQTSYPTIDISAISSRIKHAHSHGANALVAKMLLDKGLIPPEDAKTIAAIRSGRYALAEGDTYLKEATMLVCHPPLPAARKLLLDELEPVVKTGFFQRLGNFVSSLAQKVKLAAKYI
jgi:hypothetical protein